jgi:branched-chain amino acid transport system permease protein
LRVELARVALFLTIIFLLLVPFLIPSYYTQLLTHVLVLSILAMGLNLAAGYTGLPSLGHAALFGIGSYTTAILATCASHNILLAIAAGALMGTLLAVIFALICLRASKVYFLFITLALGQVVWAIVYGWRSVTGGDDGISGIVNPQLLPSFSLTGNIKYYYFTLFFFLLTYFIMFRILRSPFGYSIIGIRENEPRMRALGYDVWLHKFVAFVISGTFSGLAGVLWAYFNGFTSPHDASFAKSAETLLMVILGGAGTLSGPVLGAIIIVVIKYVVSVFTERWFLILGVVYIAAILFAPQGIIGTLRSRLGRGVNELHETTNSRKTL